MSYFASKYNYTIYIYYKLQIRIDAKTPYPNIKNSELKIEKMRDKKKLNISDVVNIILAAVVIILLLAL